MKIHLVMIAFGFKGVKYFHDYENAKRYADAIGETVDTEYTSLDEYYSIKFEDARDESFNEKPRVQFNVYNLNQIIEEWMVTQNA